MNMNKILHLLRLFLISFWWFCLFPLRTTCCTGELPQWSWGEKKEYSLERPPVHQKAHRPPALTAKSGCFCTYDSSQESCQDRITAGRADAVSRILYFKIKVKYIHCPFQMTLLDLHPEIPLDQMYNSDFDLGELQTFTLCFQIEIIQSTVLQPFCSWMWILNESSEVCYIKGQWSKLCKQGGWTAYPLFH